MKQKLELAHEWAIELLRSGYHSDDIISCAWQYADAMQAEADKREKEEQDKLKQNERNHHDALVEIGLEEWQPDWSQAPDNDVQYFAVDEGGRCGWYVSKPELRHDHWFWAEFGERKPTYDHAPSFGYTGDWRDSLRKRPE